MKTGRAGLFIFLLIAAGFMPGIVLGQAPQEEKEEITRKTVSGEVAGISANFIAVAYGINEKDRVSLEMAFEVDKNVKIDHKKSIKEIGLGDTVEVAYDEIKKIDAQGKVKSSRRLARVVVFLRAAPLPNPESSVMVSGQPLEEEE